MNYPRNIIAAYASGGITRELFQKQLAAWQKARGINYDCHSGIYIEYRNHRARIKDGVLVSVYGTARSVFEFRRKVDFAMNRAAIWS